MTEAGLKPFGKRSAGLSSFTVRPQYANNLPERSCTGSGSLIAAFVSSPDDGGPVRNNRQLRVLLLSCRHGWGRRREDLLVVFPRFPSPLYWPGNLLEPLS